MRQVTFNVTRVVDKVGLEQSAHESDLVQEFGLADELSRFCATNFDASVHRHSHNGLMDKQVDELVAVKRELEALDGIKDRLQQVLLKGNQVLEDTKGTIVPWQDN